MLHLLTAHFFLNAFVTDTAVFAVVLTLYTVNFLPLWPPGVGEELVNTDSLFSLGANSIGVNK